MPAVRPGGLFARCGDAAPAADHSLYADRLVFLTISWISQILYWCLLGAIVLGMVLVGLALWNRVQHRTPPPVAGAEKSLAA